MALTLKNYATTLTPNLIAQAKKNKVRECDETEKGQYVAYVDDGSDSFDVSLTISAKNEVTKHSCECENAASFCRHKVALLMHIANGEKPKAIVKVKKKENKAESLFDNVDPGKLKEWVKGLIAKNKDIELSFLNYFSPKQLLSPDDVKKIVNDAVKAIAGNKKATDQTQIKKLVELWSEVLAPIVEDHEGSVTNEKLFLNFHIMIETCLAFQFKVDSSSNKIPKFIEEVLKRSMVAIGELQVEEGWDKATGYFIDQIPNRNQVRMEYLVHLKNIIEISSEERRVRLISRLAKQYEKSQPDTLMNGTTYCKFVFAITDEYKLFPKYSRLFKPIVYGNEYNHRLIRLLIDNDELDLAKKYCTDQIQYNSREEYNIAYWVFLREICLIKKDEEALAKVLVVLFPFTLDLDDYLFISERMPEEERKKWRTKALAKARSGPSSNKREAQVFCFKLADAEKTYSKMIGYIGRTTPYSLILQYFEKMAIADKNKFIAAILDRSDDDSWGYRSEDREKDRACFPELFSSLEKLYTANYLKMAIQNKEKERYYFRAGEFINYMKQQLLGHK